MISSSLCIETGALYPMTLCSGTEAGIDATDCSTSISSSIDILMLYSPSSMLSAIISCAADT